MTRKQRRTISKKERRVTAKPRVKLLSPGEMETIPLLPETPLLVTESTMDFDRLQKALFDEFKPLGVVDRIYMSDIAYITWETLRWRRCKVAIIHSWFPHALETLLEQLLRKVPDYQFEVESEEGIARQTPNASHSEDEDSEEGQQVESASEESDIKERAQFLAERWFADPSVRRQFAKLLATYHLDESAIEAEAFRQAARDLEFFDRLLVSLEARRTRALRCMEEYRIGFARQVRETTDRIIRGKVLELEHAGDKSEAA